MLCLAALGLLLASAVTLSSSALVLENGLPNLWSQTAGQVTELPMQDGILTPNPWNYLNRQSFYRLVIAGTDPYLTYMGTTQTENPFWGLALQLGWMKSSGRLADPSGSTTCGLQTGDAMCISPESFWGCMNYFTSALPFLSAAQQGFLGENIQIKLQVPAGVEGFCSTYTECSASHSDAMTKWDAFFQALKPTSESTLPDNEKKDSILGVYWVAQMATTYASSTCNVKKSHYSAEEQSFADSWLDSAEYVAAAHFHSNLEKSVLFLNPLPSRILRAGDAAPNIADLTQEENNSLKIFSWMKNINTILGGSMVRMWKGAMCSVTTREKGKDLLEQLLTNPSFPTASFLSFITEMTTAC
ncbi:liver-enriched gene 1, tandem duplicate 1 [Poecilia latipinna]|uniref:Protein LEG1 homolog n=1 Tax=Poecilia formosa TaxID=48698 RepID=A0A087Y3S4_POEFO|nr:PREDICTED: protein LEG1 homolog [Poecilia formosa]XP_014909392.1 PREDICTED: protein LEG1 homolog [Poecilia latipinna]XP_014909393.1 PREDICTED: protein LEG1 homolog [Poecilia latipinna]